MFEKILCPVDFSPKSEVALKKAIALAKLCGSALVLLNVHEEFLSRQEMVMLRVSEQTFEELQKQRAVASRRRMQEMVAEIGGDDLTLEITYLLREGKPHQQIVRVAEDIGADLIVMATNGRDSLDEWLLGSNTERVVRHARCSVLAVRG